MTAEDGAVIDLSRLVLRTGARETTDHSDNRFFINVCRALSHDRIPELCGGGSAAP